MAWNQEHGGDAEPVSATTDSTLRQRCWCPCDRIDVVRRFVVIAALGQLTLVLGSTPGDGARLDAAPSAIELTVDEDIITACDSSHLVWGGLAGVAAVALIVLPMRRRHEPDEA